MKTLLTGFVCLCAAAVSPAALIFNNGTPDTSQADAWGIAASRLADDFSLGGPATLSAIRFWMVSVAGEFAGTLSYAVYQDAAGALGSVVGSGTVNVSPVFLNQIPQFVQRYYQVDFNLPAPLALGAGTYWLELHNGSDLTNSSSAQVLWGVVAGDPPGNAKLGLSAQLPSSNTFDALAFQLYSADTAPVPEPSTLGICGIGLVALGLFRRASL